MRPLVISVVARIASMRDGVVLICTLAIRELLWYTHPGIFRSHLHNDRAAAKLAADDSTGLNVRLSKSAGFVQKNRNAPALYRDSILAMLVPFPYAKATVPYLDIINHFQIYHEKVVHEFRVAADE